MKDFIKKLDLPTFGVTDTSTLPESLGFLSMLKESMLEGKCVYKTSFTGFKAIKFMELVAKIKELGVTCNMVTTEGSYKQAIFTNSNSIINLSWGSENFSITTFSLDQSFSSAAAKLAKNNADKPKKLGHVFAMMKSGGGISLSRMGYAGANLETSNYSKKVMEDYNYIIRDLKSSDPAGRIIIFDGPPGVGKTWLIRSIINSVEDAMFVIVPPSMVSALGGPELLPLLVQNRQTWSKNGPTVLILEDADQCLAPRGADNIGSISSLLNLGDGIFGSLLDIRIVATTNAKSEEMDEAIMRPGRLSRRISVGSLSYEEANAIYRRLVGEKDLSLPEGEGRTLGFESQRKAKNYTLADVYKHARENGWQPPVKDNTESLDE